MLLEMGRRELMFWYRIYERQAVEEEIVNECLFPPGGGKPRKVPGPARMKQLVEERIQRARERKDG